MSFFQVASPDRCRETVWIAIRLLDYFVHIVEAERGQNGAKDFFLGNLHVVLHSPEDCRLNEKPLAAVDRDLVSARDQLGAFLLPCLYVAENGSHLLLADDCAHAGFGIERIGWLHLLCASYKFLQEFV